MIKALVIATAAALTATPAESQELTSQGILAIAKMAGACGILDSMIQFQKTTRMEGGNEFVARFWAVEAARLGMSLYARTEGIGPSHFETMPSRRYGGPSPQMPALLRRAEAWAST